MRLQPMGMRRRFTDLGKRRQAKVGYRLLDLPTRHTVRRQVIDKLATGFRVAKDMDRLRHDGGQAPSALRRDHGRIDARRDGIVSSVATSQERSRRNVFGPTVDLNRRQQEMRYIVQVTSKGLAVAIDLRNRCAQ